jgi:signal transduction histidine kinase
MSAVEGLLALLKKRITGILLMAIMASALLILINYASLKITSSVRSYINGESQYSKGQKDATRNLIMYLNTADTLYWDQFQKELNVPMGDSIARMHLMADGDLNAIKQGFLQGRNKKEDLDEMIWLFQNFKNVSFMSDAIAIWKKADVIIGKVRLLGEEAHEKMKLSTLSNDEKDSLIRQLNLYTAELTQQERAFSESLGAGARKINNYLFYANVVLTLLIMGIMINYIIKIVKQLRERNHDLVVTNQELDKFVYSASHDLRAPISSMKGLVSIISAENNQHQIETYLELMTLTLDKQDQFIREIIDFSRNKKTQVDNFQVSLEKIITEVILQHQHMPGANTITITKDIKVDLIHSDPVRLEIILKNLISNAIKYSDPGKDDRYISIKTSKSDYYALIIVEDNGIGIEENHLGKIFDMFFVTDHSRNGSGLGLYITLETVTKMGGTIEVESEKRKGTSFSVRIPANVIL